MINPTISLRDEFDDNRSAGAVNGTLATDGINTRTVIDSSGGISIAAGNLNFAQTNSNWHVVGWPVQVRQPGKILICRKTVSTAGYGGTVAFSTSIGSSGGRDNVEFITGAILRTGSINLGAWSTGMHSVAVAMRAAGFFAFYDGILVWINHLNSDDLFPIVTGQSTSALYTADYVRVAGYWLPTPLVSDGFGSSFGSSDGLGHAEVSGIGSGGSGVMWTTRLGTIGITSNRAQPSALTSGEAAATATLSTANVYASAKLWRSAGTVGIHVRYVDANNLVRVIHNGASVVVTKIVAGTPTTVSTTAATYSAGAALVVDANGTAFRVYYNNALVTTATISDSALQSGTGVEIYYTDTSNQIDDFVVYAKGTGGEYNSDLQIVMSNERTSAMSLADSLLKVPVKILSDILSLSDSVLRTIIKSEPVQMALSSVAVKVPVKMLSDVLSLSDSVLRTIIKSEAVQMAIDSTATKTVIKIFSDGMAFTRAQAINYGKRIIRIIRLLGNIGAN